MVFLPTLISFQTLCIFSQKIYFEEFCEENCSGSHSLPLYFCSYNASLQESNLFLYSTEKYLLLKNKHKVDRI